MHNLHFCTDVLVLLCLRVPFDKGRLSAIKVKLELECWLVIDCDNGKYLCSYELLINYNKLNKH